MLMAKWLVNWLWKCMKGEVILLAHCLFKIFCQGCRIVEPSEFNKLMVYPDMEMWGGRGFGTLGHLKFSGCQSSSLPFPQWTGFSTLASWACPPNGKARELLPSWQQKQSNWPGYQSVVPLIVLAIFNLKNFPSLIFSDPPPPATPRFFQGSKLPGNGGDCSHHCHCQDSGKVSLDQVKLFHS